MGNLGLHHPFLHGSVHTPDEQQVGHPTITRGSSMQVNSLHFETNDM